MHAFNMGGNMVVGCADGKGRSVRRDVQEVPSLSMNIRMRGRERTISAQRRSKSTFTFCKYADARTGKDDQCARTFRKYLHFL